MDESVAEHAQAMISALSFQGFGNDREIGPATRLECKICWTVYDPAEGDPVWQVPPGTPFDQLAAALDLPQLLGAARPVHGDRR